jgi:hypothetical protein
MVATMYLIKVSKASEVEFELKTYLNTVVTVRKVVHSLELLVDNPDASLMSPVGNLLDVLGALAHSCQLPVDNLRALNGGLRVELGCQGLIVNSSNSHFCKLTWVGNLEENVLHDVAAVWALELELVALEQNVIETPDGGGQNSGNTALTLLDLQDEVDSTLASITSSPRLSGHGVGGVSVGTETLAVHPSLGDGISGLLLVETEHLSNHSSGGNLDQHNVVQADPVVRILQGQNTLDFVGLDHGLQHFLDLHNLAISEVTSGTVGAGDPVSDSENTAQIVGGVTPLGGKPAVIVVKPPDHGTNVEGTIDRVQLVGSTRDTGTVRNNSALNNGTQQLGAFFESQGLQSATQGVEED